MIKIRGTIQLTGPHGTGKSEFALQYGDLTKTCLLDDDIKGRSTYEAVNEILKQSKREFGRYVDIIEYLGGTLMTYERYEKLNRLVDGLEHFETIIIDTWSQWGNICREYAKHNPEMFRKPTKNRTGQDIYRSSNSQIMQGEISADGRELEAVLLEKLRSKCE
ncbi:MAG: AAA family ATPase, partial [Candidatus Thorarchaeota archaeon]